VSDRCDSPWLLACRLSGYTFLDPDRNPDIGIVGDTQVCVLQADKACFHLTRTDTETENRYNCAMCDVGVK